MAGIGSFAVAGDDPYLWINVAVGWKDKWMDGLEFVIAIKSNVV